MLYVAGEILLWMVLAFLLGIGLGWLIWGSRPPEADRREREAQQQSRWRSRRPSAPASRSRSSRRRGRVTARPSLGCRPSPRPRRGHRQRCLRGRSPPTPGADLQAQLAAAVEERTEAEQRRARPRTSWRTTKGGSPSVRSCSRKPRRLGRPVIIDDLKVVEGIGPQVEEVLQSAGITNWTTLAKSTPAALRDIPDAAGPEFNAHDPSTWPQQAVLAIGGHWHTLRSLQDSPGGRVANRVRPQPGWVPSRPHGGLDSVVRRRLPKARSAGCRPQRSRTAAEPAPCRVPDRRAPTTRPRPANRSASSPIQEAVDAVDPAEQVVGDDRTERDGDHVPERAQPGLEPASPARPPASST